MKHTIGTAMALALATAALSLTGCSSEAGETEIAAQSEPLGAQPTLYNWVTLAESSPFAPSLKIGSASGVLRTFLAWTGSDSGKSLNLMNATDCKSYGHKVTLGESSSDGPILAALGTVPLVVGWKGNGNNGLNVQQVSVDSSGNMALTGNKNVVPNVQTLSRPALVYNSSGILFLAWRGTDNRISLALSTDYGASFKGTWASGEYTDQAPVLGMNQSTILLGWKGNGNTNPNIATVTYNSSGVTGLTNKNIIQEATNYAPAVQVLTPNVMYGWMGTDGQLNIMASNNNGTTFTNKQTEGVYSSQGPGMGACNDPAAGAVPTLGWISNDSNKKINVASVTYVK